MNKEFWQNLLSGTSAVVHSVVQDEVCIECPDEEREKVSALICSELMKWNVTQTVTLSHKYGAETNPLVKKAKAEANYRYLPMNSEPEDFQKAQLQINAHIVGYCAGQAALAKRLRLHIELHNTQDLTTDEDCLIQLLRTLNQVIKQGE